METIFQKQTVQYGQVQPFELDFRKEGKNLVYGELYLHDMDHQDAPLIILCHGITGTVEKTRKMALELCACGYVCYCFDFCSGVIGSRSEGSSLDMSVKTEAEDLKTVFEGIQIFSLTKNRKLFVLGQSQGGFVAVLAWPFIKENAEGMILMYPAFTISQNTRDSYPDKDAVPKTGELLGLQISDKYALDAWDIEIYDEFSRIDKPVLIIHGDEDSLVPAEASQKAHEVLKHSQLEILKGAGHGFNAEQTHQAAKLSHAFIQSAL